MNSFYVILLLILLLIASVVAVRSTILYRKYKAGSKGKVSSDNTVQLRNVLKDSNQKISNAIISSSKVYYLGVGCFFEQDREQLKEIDNEIEELNQRARSLKANISNVVRKLHLDSVETGHYYVQIVDYLREMAHSVKYVVRPLFEHLENNRKPFTKEQIEDLSYFSSIISDFLNFALHIVKESKFEHIDELILRRQSIIQIITELEKKQLHRIKKKDVNSRNSLLFFNFMSESKNLLLQTVNLVKSTRDFVTFSTDK
jgi:Na+/phosphate symporter